MYKRREISIIPEWFYSNSILSCISQNSVSHHCTTKKRPTPNTPPWRRVGEGCPLDVYVRLTCTILLNKMVLNRKCWWAVPVIGPTIEGAPPIREICWRRDVKRQDKTRPHGIYDKTVIGNLPWSWHPKPLVWGYVANKTSPDGGFVFRQGRIKIAISWTF